MEKKSEKNKSTQKGESKRLHWNWRMITYIEEILFVKIFAGIILSNTR